MGLNTNYHFLINKNSSNYRIPEYINYFQNDIIPKESMLQNIFKFNQDIRDISYYLDNINTLDISNNINDITNATSKAKYDISYIRKMIINFFEYMINVLKKQKPKDYIENKFSYREILNLLKNAIGNNYDNRKDYTINIYDVNIKKSEVLNVNFPEYNNIDTCLYHLLNNIFGNINITDEDMIFWKLFNNEDICSNNILYSTLNICNREFGSSKKYDTEINSDLYMMAKENIDNKENVINAMIYMKDKTNTIFSKILNHFNSIDQYVYKELTKLTKDRKLTKVNFINCINDLINKINKSLDIFSKAISFIYYINIYRIYRIYDVFSLNGSSENIKSYCYNLIRNYLEIETNDNNCFNGIDAIGESMDDFNRFPTISMISYELLLEDSFNDNIIHIINEADTNNKDTKSTNKEKTSIKTTISTTKEKASAKLEKTRNVILDWLKGLTEKFGQMIEKFKNRCNEIIMKQDGKHFWLKNRDAIGKLVLKDTKVNQWFQFNLSTFEISTYIKMDLSSLSNPIFQSDKSFQDAILKKIYSNSIIPEAKENESFSDMVKKAYQGAYINNENGDGVFLNQTNYNHALVCKFINDLCMHGFEGKSLGSVIKDYNNIKNNINDIQKNYRFYARQMGSIPSKPTPTQPTKESYIIKEADIEVGSKDASNAGNVLSDVGNNEFKNNKLDDMIKRCFNYNTMAVTAKMTAAVAAYKQYMGLFKSVYKAKTTNKENK